MDDRPSRRDVLCAVGATATADPSDRSHPLDRNPGGERGVGDTGERTPGDWQTVGFDSDESHRAPEVDGEQTRRMRHGARDVLFRRSCPPAVARNRRAMLRSVAAGTAGILSGCVTFDDEPACTHDTTEATAIGDVADGTWPTWGYDPANTAANSGATSPDLNSAAVAWDVTLSAASTGPPLIANGHVYVHTQHGYVVLDADGGGRRWTLGGPGEPRVLGHALADGASYIARFRPGDDESDHVIAVDAQTGNRRWRSPTASLPNSVTVTDREVVVGTVGPSGTTDGWVHSVDPADGDERWRTELNGDVRTRPVVTEDIVIVGTDDQRLVALDRSNGAPCWRVDLAGFPWRAAVSDGRVYVGTTSPGQNWRRLEVRDGTDGALRWQTDALHGTPTRLIDQFAVVNGTALLSNRKGVYALADDGSTTWVWERSDVGGTDWRNHALVIAGDLVVTGGPESLRAVELASGDSAGSLSLDATVAGLSVAGESLFVSAIGKEGDGRVLAVR